MDKSTWSKIQEQLAIIDRHLAAIEANREAIKKASGRIKELEYKKEKHVYERVR